MIPQLVRFYGGDPMRWLMETPTAVVMAHIEMMGRLEAAESMTAASRLAMGLRLQPAEGLWERLSAAARGGRRDQGDMPSVSPSALSAMGIGVVIQARKAPAAEVVRG